ncbi:hypothetical protein EJO68_15140 [Variovorax atrisoli]|uniref:hypothetical protein n=1 Tax=Variovorax atrisoli TaxID=3394203 RepID=UPI000F7E36F3|nr:hypothetical protein [Variovorax sp. 369]RTD92579.1 hypothetical protein EJO68_15140 [Variovorax sp. 369]
MKISLNARDSLYWFSGLLVLFAILIAMAGIGKMPPSLDRLAVHEIQPTKVLREFVHNQRAGYSTDMRYMLAGLDDQKREISFGFPSEPQVLERLQRITMDSTTPARVKLWVEKSDFATVMQLQQGDRMIWSLAEATAESWQSAKDRFLQSGLVLLVSAALFLFARKVRVAE